jgi:3-oxoacyl-[acyl-carrier protein] reductase
MYSSTAPGSRSRRRSPIWSFQIGGALSTNLDGVFLGTRHALRTMNADTGGCIVNVASAAGIKPITGNAGYGTSKAAIRFFTQVAALEG